MKEFKYILEYGKIKPFINEKITHMIGLDLETVDNEIFLIGTYEKDNYNYSDNNIFDFFFNTLLYATQNGKNIATWTRYDNTHLLKLIFNYIDNDNIIDNAIKRINKLPAKFNRKLEFYEIEPLLSIKFNDFTINIDNVIRNCILFRVFDKYGKNKTVWSFDIRNLFTGFNLLQASIDNGFSYYDKLDIEFHIINKQKYLTDSKYKENVLKSNELDSRVVYDLAYKIQNDFYDLFNAYPNTLISTGSLARSSIIAMSDKLNLNLKRLNITSFTSEYNSNHSKMIDYSMRAYHGGKIESEVLGYFKNAEMMDITSAYPAILRELKGFNRSQIIYKQGKPLRSDYNYMFIKCNLYIKDKTLSTPFIIKNPLNNHSNLNPYGYIKEIVLTKYDYQFILKNLDKIDIEYIDYFYIVSDNQDLIYKPIIDTLFKLRMKYKKENNKSLDNLAKTIINSLYGITYELNDLYDTDLNNIGYRAGDYFNPVIASHITAGTRVKISEMNNHIINKGGKVLLNMTDSIIYTGTNTLDKTYKDKILGEFENADILNEVIILGSGRYEYMKNSKYYYMTRGFTAKTDKDSYYKKVLNNSGIIDNTSFITPFKSTTGKWTWQDIGLIYNDTYTLQPFNLGGKRFIDNKDYNVDLRVNNIDTHKIYLDKDLYNKKSL